MRRSAERRVRDAYKSGPQPRPRCRIDACCQCRCVSSDLMALLNANACLSCHAIDQKIVGPGYREVAARYKGDAQALTKLEASIRQGSAGKWGPAPMPPFAALSEAQVKAIAAFVLAQ